MENTTRKEEGAPLITEMGVSTCPPTDENSQVKPLKDIKNNSSSDSKIKTCEVTGAAKEPVVSSSTNIIEDSYPQDITASSTSQALDNTSKLFHSGGFLTDELVISVDKEILPLLESQTKSSSISESTKSKEVLPPKDTSISHSSKGVPVSNVFYSRSSVTLSTAKPLATIAEARIRHQLDSSILPTNSYTSATIRAHGLSYPRPVYGHPSTNTGMQPFYSGGHLGRPPVIPPCAGTMVPVFGDSQFQSCITRSTLLPSGMHGYAWNSGIPSRSTAPLRYGAPINSSNPHVAYRPRTSHPTQQLRISRWVNPIPPDPDDGPQQSGEQELATKLLQIQSKRFYIDVKQNRRGRFMKVAEIGADGRRNQIFLALSTAEEFKENLSVFSVYYANLGPPNPDALPEDGKLKSETMVKDNRRYYLDLKENARGRFLRVSQTIARGGPRCQIAIPAQGLIEFRDALQELLEEFGTDDGGYKGELPEGRHMRVENKNFYFDIGQNNRGIYMRISEVKTNFRTAITIPEKSWSRFRDIFADYVDKMKEGEKSTSESNK